MQVYTVGQVAKILDVSPRTVVKQCDAGFLPHHRVPESRDRRITKQAIIEYCEKYGIDLNKLPGFEAALPQRKQQPA